MSPIPNAPILHLRSTHLHIRLPLFYVTQPLYCLCSFFTHGDSVVSLSVLSRLCDYMTKFVCFELWTRYNFSWFEANLECGRAPSLEICGLLTIGNNHVKNVISLLETLKYTTESQ